MRNFRKRTSNIAKKTKGAILVCPRGKCKRTRNRRNAWRQLDARPVYMHIDQCAHLHQHAMHWSTSRMLNEIIVLLKRMTLWLLWMKPTHHRIPRSTASLKQEATTWIIGAEGIPIPPISAARLKTQSHPLHAVTQFSNELQQQVK